MIKDGGPQFDRDADIDLMVRPLGEVFQLKYPFGISNVAPYDGNVYGCVSVVEEKSDIVLRVRNISNDTSISGRFGILLFDN